MGSSKPGSREIHINLWYTFRHDIQVPSCATLCLHWRSLSQAAPGWCIGQRCLTHGPQAEHSTWRIYSLILHISSVYGTLAPIWNCASSYGDRAAKCKMERAQERSTPAVPSERLRSQNIPPRHTMHASSHPSPVYQQWATEVWVGHYRTSLKRWSLDINSKCNLFHRMYFKPCSILLQVIPLSRDSEFSWHCFGLCIRILHSP